MPPLELIDFKEKALHVFDQLDPLHLGAVSTETLAKAVADPTITGSDAQALAAMYGLKHEEMNIAQIESKPSFHGVKGFVPADTPGLGLLAIF